MTLSTSLLAFDLVLMTGLAAWLVVVATNNIVAFRGGTFSIGMLMSMSLFEQEPRIDSPLLSRRITRPAWHRLAYGILVSIEVCVALMLVNAALGFGSALLGRSEPIMQVRNANVALTGLLGMSFVMLVGGSWFAYYIRQEGTQITHLVLIATCLGALLALNLPVVLALV